MYSHHFYQRKMQEDLNKIHQWTSQITICFNDKKIELMRYGKTECNRSTYSRPGDGEVDEVHDLGIVMAKSATFESDIEKIN